MVVANKRFASSAAMPAVWHITIAVERQPVRSESPVRAVGRCFRVVRTKKLAGQPADHGYFVPRNSRKLARSAQVAAAQWSGAR